MGLASLLAVVTIGLTVTDRLQLFINPAQTWFACGMAVLLLIGAVASFALPLGAEHHEHGHDHGSASRASAVALAATVAGGVVASAVAVAAVVFPPATLSAELAMERDTGSAPLFAGADDVQLGVVDTSTFGVGDWSATFATATSPERYAGEQVRLTGFVADDGGSLSLNRLVITHCVIDAQPASLPVDAAGAGDLSTGEWVELTGEVVVDDSGALRIEASSMDRVSEPEEPYEY